MVNADLRKFAAAAWESPHKVVDDWVNAPGGTYFLGDAVLGSTLYIRECYTALYKKLEELKRQGIAHVVITGYPGLGTSWLPCTCWSGEAGRTS